MSSTLRKKSPRSPSASLPEALERAIKVYDKDRRHPAPTEVFATNLGYKSANSGSALTMIASLRYFGLVERVSDGVLAISKDVESYKYAPSEDLKTSLLRRFLRNPPLYSELLDKYSSGLPSDANLRYELIKRGFAPAAAESALVAFRESVAFVRYFETAAPDADESAPVPDQGSASLESSPAPQAATVSVASIQDDLPSAEEDRIPVRLPKGRRAWLVIPVPFYEADKARLKAQIDLLLTIDEEQEEEDDT